jgi:mRNA interferase RelE/StbE
VYKLLFTRQAAKALQKAPHLITDSIREKLDQIANDPFSPHHNAIKLQGRPGYRLRVGDWRIIYEIKQDEVIIIVIKIAPRSEVYR